MEKAKIPKGGVPALIASKVRGLEAQREDRLAAQIISPSKLPPLRGADVAMASEIRRKVLAFIATHRSHPALELAVVKQLLSHSKADWWEDAMYSSGTIEGVYRVLEREAWRRKKAAEVNRKNLSLSDNGKACYFIDGENVAPAHACVQNILKEKNANIVLFTSPTCMWPKKAIKQVKEDHPTISLTKIPCINGQKSAMDFQITGVVGEYLAANPTAIVRIVSNDHDYDPAVQMWQSRGYLVKRISDQPVFQPQPQPQQASVEASTPPAKVEVDEETKRTMIIQAGIYLKWDGYISDEKARLARIVVSYALGEYPVASLHSAIGKYMQCGNRFTKIYTAERKNIEEFYSYLVKTGAIEKVPQ